MVEPAKKNSKGGDGKKKIDRVHQGAWVGDGTAMCSLYVALAV